MKRYMSIFLLIILLLINTSLAFADETAAFNPRNNISIEKEWKIRLTQSVDEKSISENVLIVDENENIIPTRAAKLDQTGKIISIAPLNDYKYSTKYYLLIKKTLISRDTQKNLNNEVRMEFTTESKSEVGEDTEIETGIKEKILGSWSTKYNGITADIKFNEDNTCNVKASIATATGQYNIIDDNMTMNLMGRQKSGKIIFEGNDKFTIVSENGSTMIFTR